MDDLSGCYFLVYNLGMIDIRYNSKLWCMKISIFILSWFLSHANAIWQGKLMMYDCAIITVIVLNHVMWMCMTLSPFNHIKYELLVMLSMIYLQRFQ